MSRGDRSGSILDVPSFPASIVRQAVAALGWPGDVVGPVEFAGARFRAVVQIDDVEPVDAPSGRTAAGLRLVGALFQGEPTPRLLRAASLLAAYAPRAVLVPERADLTGFLVDAALLDQGVVVAGPRGLRVLSTPGPRATRGPVTPFDRDLLRRLHRARQRRLAMLPIPG